MPGILSHSKRNQRAIEELLANPSVRRVIGYGNSESNVPCATCHVIHTIKGVFRFYFPKIYKEYDDNMLAMLLHQVVPTRPISNSVFAAASFNFGPRAVTHEHTDSGNKANGPCPIFCTGTFDPKKGGHLVFRQLKLLVEFPPGSLALIPSATLMHGNVAIRRGEQRESFTQYAAGGLFRWVGYGFRSWSQLEEDEQSLIQELNARKTRWAEALDRFSTIQSLHNDRSMYA